MNIKIKDCFTEFGMLKFDPYRISIASDKWYLYQACFNDYGFLKNPQELKDLIEHNKNRWRWDCDAIGLYHAETLANATKGSYPTYCYFR